MSGSTPRVSLYKPAGGENVNVTTDLNNNFDKIDTNLNFRVAANATARNAISPFWEGLNVRDSDTGKCYVSNGTAPISASWQELVQTNVRTTDELLLGNLTRIQRAASTDSAVEARVTGDGNARWFTRISGEMWWGAGSSVADTNLYRSAANTLKTDDSFIISGDLTVGGIGEKRYTDLTVNQTYTSTTTFANVSDLSFSVAANHVYTFKAVLFVSSAANAAGDVKFTFTCPTGATWDAVGNGADVNIASGSQQSGDWIGRVNTGSAGANLNFGASTTTMGIVIEGKVNVGGTAGTFTLQGSQFTSNANTTTLLARSYMTIEMVE